MLPPSHRELARLLAVRVSLLPDARVAVLGDCLATDEQCAAAAGQGITALMNLPGSFHAVIAYQAGLVAAGDIAGFRRLFTTRTHDVPVLASHADVLRRLTGASVDRVWLACRLASPEAPSVVRDARSPFTGVVPVQAGHRIEVTCGPAGIRCQTARWWTPPAARDPRASGALALREALTAAVTGRIDRAAGPVSVQLSGGLDSTALAALAHPVRPLLVTTAGRSPVEDDLAWAQRAAGLLPDAAHRVIGADEAPLFFADLGISTPGLDEPAPFAAGAARQRYAAGVLAEHSTAVNLNGQGGDEVLLAPLAYLRSALHAVPRTGWRHLRGHAALRGVRLPAMARAVARRESFGAWLHRVSGRLRSEPPTADGLTAWEAPPVVPPWATDQAVDLVRSAIDAAEPSPVTDDQATHAAIVRIRASAYRAALYRDAMAVAGVPTAMPFFDGAVVRACLSTRPWERTDPWQPKPLLRAALADVVPENLLCRRTKSGYNADVLHGWAAHRDQIARLLARPRLAEHGLVDPDRLRRALAAFGPSGLAPGWVTDLIAIETWLRDLDGDRDPDLARPGSPCGVRTAAASDHRPLLTVQPGAQPTGHRTIRLASTVQVTRVDDGTTLLDVQRGKLHHVNQAGAVILAALTADTAIDSDSPIDSAVERAAAVVARRYGIPTEQARADVEALLDQLRDHKLLGPPGRPLSRRRRPAR